MANYWTSFSVLLPVGAGNVEAALALYSQVAAELEANQETIGFVAEKDEVENDAVWLWDGGDGGDPEHVIAYACRCAEAFSLEGLWGFHWGLGCSRPHLDGFGGGAQVLDLGRRVSVDWLDTEHWIAEQLGKGEASAVMAETILQPVAAAQGWNTDSQMFVLLGFIDSLIGADPGIANRLRAHLADVSAADEDFTCRECGADVFMSDAGTSHHAGHGLDGIDHARDRDHTALPEKEP